MREEDEMISIRSECMGFRRVTLAHPTSLMCRLSPLTPVQRLEFQASPREKPLLRWVGEARREQDGWHKAA